MNTAILLAAGNGSRMQGRIVDKILAPLAGKPVISHSVQTFGESGIVSKLVIVHSNSEQKEAIKLAIESIDLHDIPVQFVTGGERRQDSVYNGLKYLASVPSEYVFIHDCARPLVSIRALTLLYKAVVQDKAAVLAHTVTDTIKRIPQADQLKKTSMEDLDRSRLWAMETPQAFEFKSIFESYSSLTNEQNVTDDIAVASLAGIQSTIVPNPDPNPKITQPADLDYVRWLLESDQ